MRPVALDVTARANATLAARPGGGGAHEMRKAGPGATGAIPSVPAADPAHIVALRAAMLRFARRQMHSEAAAEDMVQDAIEAALRAAHTFEGRSSLSSWVFAILRHRIVDHIRRNADTLPMSSLVEDDADWQEHVAALFDRQGRWHDDARAALGPPARLESVEFWETFEACLDRLPAATARVFMMREFLGFETAEICERLGISADNCHAILHRARLRLRVCMAGQR